ncbi:GntR family transcriptional regulator [Actinomycetota bacterium]
MELLTKNDYAYATLRRLILTGELEAGSVIPQARIAEQMGLSTTPLREAIRRLAAEGLVDLSAHRDARIPPLTADEAMSLYEVRDSLDPLAAALAAERRTDDELAEIDRALAALRPLQDGADVDAMLAHRDFHRAIYRAAHNPILSASLEQLWDKADRYRALSLRTATPTATDRKRVAREHRALAQAIRHRDATTARAVMVEHIRHSHVRRAAESLLPQA